MLLHRPAVRHRQGPDADVAIVLSGRIVHCPIDTVEGGRRRLLEGRRAHVDGDDSRERHGVRGERGAEARVPGLRGWIGGGGRVEREAGSGQALPHGCDHRMLFGDGATAERNREGEDPGLGRERGVFVVGRVSADDKTARRAIVIRWIRRADNEGYAVLRLLLRNVRVELLSLPNVRPVDAGGIELLHEVSHVRMLCGCFYLFYALSISFWIVPPFPTDE